MLRSLKKRPTGSSGAALELLQSEGYQPLHGRRVTRKETDDGESRTEGSSSTLTIEQLSEKIVETIKGFHAHARFFLVRLCFSLPSLCVLCTDRSTTNSSAALATLLPSTASSSMLPNQTSSIRSCRSTLPAERRRWRIRER